MSETFFRFPISSNTLFVFSHHLYHGMHSKFTGRGRSRHGAGVSIGYLGEGRICLASDFHYRLINSYMSLVEHESILIYLWLFLLPSSKLVFDGERKHQLCAQGRQLGVRAGFEEAANFFLLSFLMFLVVSNLTGGP